MTRRHLYYDREGKPIDDMLEWGRRLQSDEYRVVEVTDVDDAVRVSTVWLGLDHNHCAEGPPLIFETLIRGGPHNGYIERYSTEADAKAGHEVAVRRSQIRVLATPEA